MKLPLQPVYKDEHGTLRFKENALVRYLLDAGGIDMNDLAIIPFDQEDREQFASLIGYSLGGFEELSYVSDEAYSTAHLMATEKAPLVEIQNKVLRETLEEVRVGIRLSAAAAFRIHPDDLEV